MRILHIIASARLSDGGPIEGAIRIGEVLARHGHSQHLMTLDDPDAPYLAEVPAQVFALGDRHAPAGGPIARFRHRFAISPRAAPWLRAHAADYDIAIVSGLWNYATLVARQVLVGHALPYVVFTHGMLDPWFRKRYPIKSAAKQMLWLANEGVLLRHAAHVLFTCDEERLLARDSFRPYRAREHVVGFGTADVGGDPVEQIRRFRAHLPALGTRPFLLFLSRIHEKKGCDLLVEAFGKVAAEAPDLDLVIAGPDQQGLKAVLEARAAEWGITARIHWPGMIGGDVKWGAFRACEAFILPSHQENFGIVLAEAMACGRPVLTTPKVNIWREIEADGAGIITPDDVAGTTEAMRRWITLAPADRAAMGQRARQSFLSRYRIDTFVAGLEALLASDCLRADRYSGSSPG